MVTFAEIKDAFESFRYKTEATVVLIDLVIIAMVTPFDRQLVGVAIGAGLLLFFKQLLLSKQAGQATSPAWPATIPLPPRAPKPAVVCGPPTTMGDEAPIDASDPNFIRGISGVLNTAYPHARAVKHSLATDEKIKG